MKPVFDIIIPTYNNLHELKNCLSGFEEQSFSDFRILICVDGSTDGTQQYISSILEEKNILPLEHDDGLNHGRNAARNLALPHIEAKYVVFIDSDLIPKPEFLQSHLNLLKSGNIVSVGDILWTNTEENIWARYQATRGKNRFIHGENIPYQFFCIGNSAMESEKFLEAKGFDEKMVHYGGNDNEFSHRLQKKYEIDFIFNMDALVEGEMNKDLKKALLQMSEFGAYNLHYLLKKFSDLPNIFQIHSLAKNSLIHRLIWLDSWELFLNMIFRFLPLSLKMKIIHYLTDKYLRKGFIDKKTVQKIKFFQY